MIYFHLMQSIKSFLCFGDMGNWLWHRRGAQGKCNFSPPRVEMTSFVCVITIEGWDTGIFGTLLFSQWVANLMKLFFLSYDI